ncbi:MAG: helix-turn-helix domain-containing protein [Beutenbergiaceae bacterium]
MTTTNQQVTDLDALRTTTCGTLNLVEVAALLGIDRRTASRGAEAGEIPHRKIQNRYLVPTWWVRDFVFGEHQDD